MYDIISFEEEDKWNNVVAGFTDNQDIYYRLSYCNLYRELGDGEPYLFVYKHEGGHKIIYPFLKRKINGLPFVNNHFTREIFDITTPYGYGGPVDSGLIAEEKENVYKAFRLVFKEFCKSENIITEFIRFHPLLHNHNMMSNLMNVQHIRDTVFIDLRKGEEEIFNNYHLNHRRNVRKGQKKGLIFNILTDTDAIEALEVFVKLYEETMDKNSASKYYYFPKTYFEDLFQHLSRNTFMAAVHFENRIAAAAIFMFEKEYVHYHLGCSDQKYLNMAPNNLLFHEAALWSKRQGFKQLHLGGGYKDNDQLFQFKYKFNPEGKLRFFIGTEVHDKEVFDQLNNLWKHYNSKEADSQYFPLYRQ